MITQLSPQEIKNFRKDVGMTQLEFALALGITPVTVSWWENGRHSPSILLLDKLLRWQEERLKTKKMLTGMFENVFKNGGGNE